MRGIIKRGPFSTAANSISACMKVASGSIRNIILKKDINKQKKSNLFRTAFKYKDETFSISIQLSE